MGKVTISTVLGYKEYVVENIKNIRGEDEENSDFRIYPDYHKIYRGQTEIVLTKAEYELFMLLSGRPGVIFTKEKIFEILYNEELPESIDNIVYCLVSSMRKKIEPELKQCRYIKTVRGVGYKFEGKKMDIFEDRGNFLKPLSFFVAFLCHLAYRSSESHLPKSMLFDGRCNRLFFYFQKVYKKVLRYAKIF